MKKLLLFLLFVLSFAVCFSQSIVNRSNSSVTVSDARLQAGLNFFAPRYLDTTAANIQKGIDSCGAIIFTYDVMSYWGRKCSPKRWELLGGSGGNTDSLFGVQDNRATANRYFSVAEVAEFLIDSVGDNFLIQGYNGAEQFGVQFTTNLGLSQLFSGDNQFQVDQDSARLLHGNSSASLTGHALVMRNTVSGGLVDYTGSVGNQNLQQVTNNGNTTDTTIFNAGNVAYETYGTVWTDNFARASFGSNYATNGAGVTYTFPSSAYLNITGTANSNNDYFTRVTDSTQENKSSITTTIVVNSKSASTFGVYIGWQGINAVATNHPVFAGVTLTTGTNNLFFLAETTPFTYTDPQSLTIAAGDTIVLTLSRVDWTYTISYFNYTGDVSRSATFTGNPQGGVLPFCPNGFSVPAFHTLGADIRVYNLSRVSNESKNARNVWGYNSLQLGGNLTDVSQKMGYVATGGNHANNIYAAGGGSVGSYLNSTYDEDLARYAAGGAENFWCQVSGNDSAFSVWEVVGKPALIAARNRWVAAGKRWIWMQPFPRNALNLRAVADTVTAIATRLGDPLAPIYDRWAVSNQLPSDFNAGDGVHLTAYANRVVGIYIDSLFPQYTRQGNTVGQSRAYTVSAQNINFNSLQEYNYTAAAQNLNLPPDVNYIRVNPSSTLAALTITLPTIVDSGHIYWISFGGQLTSGVVVTALTLNAGTGQTITRMPFVEPVGATTPINFGVGDWITCRYLNNGRWEVLPQRTGYYTDLFIAGRRLGAGLNQATQDNTVFGYAAGNTITSGTDLTFIGNQAGQLNSSGVRNTYVGNEAGMNGSTGNNNTGIGEESLRQSNGSNRTALGYASLFNTTGSDNTGAGVNVMFSNTSGANNSALGSGAGQSNQTGSNNVWVGMEAGQGVSTNSNSNNTGVGFRAGENTTTGSRNIFIGDSAAITNTTGIRNIIIGTNVNASSATASLEMNIGGLLFGSGMTGTGTTAAGLLGIGIAASTGIGVNIGGTVASGLGGLIMSSTIAPDPNTDPTGLGIATTFTEAGSGTHALISNVSIGAPNVTGGAATVTNTASLYITAASTATVTGANYSLWVDDGLVRFDNNLQLATAGGKFLINAGANGSVGQATLVGGTVTVNTTAVTAASLIFVTVATPGGTQGNLSIGTIVAGTSFVINSTSGTETSVVNWWIVN